MRFRPLPLLGRGAGAHEAELAGKLHARDERGAQLKVLGKGEELRPLQQHERQRGHRRRDRLRRRVQVHVEEDLLREGGSPDRHTTCGTHGAAVLGTHRAKHKAHSARA